MKSRVYIIIGILLVALLIEILISPFYTLGSYVFPLEHCPELAVKKALGLIDSRSGCM